MAYGLKYELFFSDVTNRQVKIEILKKDYEGVPENFPVTNIVGTGSPAVIEWDSDDDIYSPIIGSRCKLSFFITDSQVYDEFYRSDEREYKVKIKYYQPAGGNWEDEIVQYDGGDVLWDARLADAIYYQPIWEGFLVVDRYQESVLSTPFPIELEAIDGLGTLDGFDAPIDLSDNEPTSDLFFYIKEILLLTGHEFDIYIANSMRKTDGLTNDTIFHDIVVNKYSLMKENLTLRTAKEVLELILKMTNSRVFQSYGRWYIVNNSSLIDNRVDINQEIVSAGAGSGADDNDDPATPTPPDVHSAPDIVIDGESPMYVGSYYQLFVRNSGSQIQTYTWTRPDLTTESRNYPTFDVGNVTLANNGDVYLLTVTDFNGNTDSASFTLNVQNRPQTSSQQEGTGTDTTPVNDVNEITYQLKINTSERLTGAYISPSGSPAKIITYTSGQSGDAFTANFDVSSLTGEFTSLSQITALTISGGYSVSKQLIGEFIRVTVTGNLPIGGGTADLYIAGQADVQQFTTTFTPNSSVTNATFTQSPAGLSATGGEGKPYSMTITYTANSGYEFYGGGAIQVRSSANIGQSITTSFTSSTFTITITGQQSINDQTATLTLTGAPVYSAAASSLSINPSGTESIGQSGGYFYLYISNSDGGYTIESTASWLTLSAYEGGFGNQRVKVTIQPNNRRERTGYIRLKPRASSTILATLRLDQDSGQSQ